MKKFSVKPSLDNPMTDSDELYFDVLVYKTQAGMARKWKATLPNDAHEWNLLRAGVLPSDTYIGDNLSPRLGLVLLCEQYMNVGIIAHEAVHMATTYLRRKGKLLGLGNEVDDNEERIAYAAGVCANQIAMEFGLAYFRLTK